MRQLRGGVLPAFSACFLFADVRQPCIMQAGRRDHSKGFYYLSVRSTRHPLGTSIQRAMSASRNVAIRRNLSVALTLALPQLCRSAKGKERGRSLLRTLLRTLLLSLSELDCNPDADSRGALVARLTARSGPEGAQRATNSIPPAYVQCPFAYCRQHPTLYPIRHGCVIGKLPGCVAGSPSSVVSSE